MASQHQPPEIEAALTAVAERRVERVAKEIAAKAMERAVFDGLGYRLNAIENVLSQQVVASASISLRAIRILIENFRGVVERVKAATGESIPCVACDHVLARHPICRIDVDTGDGEWTPEFCTGDDGDGCENNCTLFEIPEGVETPPGVIKLPRATS